MTDDEIYDLADPFLEWTEQGYAVIDKIGFARVIERNALERASQKFEDAGDPYGAQMIRALIQDASIKGEQR